MRKVRKRRRSLLNRYKNNMVSRSSKINGGIKSMNDLQKSVSQGREIAPPTLNHAASNEQSM